MADGYYVSVFRDSRHRYARGPFPSREAAEAAVGETSRLASAKDPWSDFDAWGVTKLTMNGPTPLPIGPMNIFWTADGY